VPVRQGARLACHNTHDPIVAIQNIRKPAGQGDRDLGYFAQGKLGSRLEEIGVMTYQKVASAQMVGMLREVPLQSSEPTSRRNPVFEFTKADFRTIDEL
jgi:hypothetical protein